MKEQKISHFYWLWKLGLKDTMNIVTYGRNDIDDIIELYHLHHPER